MPPMPGFATRSTGAPRPVAHTSAHATSTAMVPVQHHFGEEMTTKASIRLVKKATKINPAWARVPFDERVRVLAEARAQVGREPWVLHLVARLRRGDFMPLAGESVDDQVDRARAEALHKRRNQPKGHDGEIHLICLLCGMTIWATPTDNGIPHGNGPCGPCMSSMRPGWHYAVMSEIANDLVFPSSSIYWRWLESIAPLAPFTWNKWTAFASFKAFARATMVYPGRRELLEDIAQSEEKKGMRGRTQRKQPKRSLEVALRKLEEGPMVGLLPGNAHVTEPRIAKPAERTEHKLSSKDKTWELIMSIVD
ncbi:hypothetical protein HK101_006863 [Irineochytrium annulatum]|nr:hypothetical protein HK101_006863 [Irineochytrium annulatum]